MGSTPVHRPDSRLQACTNSHARIQRCNLAALQRVLLFATRLPWRRLFKPRRAGPRGACQHHSDVVRGRSTETLTIVVQ